MAQGSTQSGLFNGVARLLTTTAAVEMGAGLVLLVAPAAVIRVLFGPVVDVVPAVGMGRLAGAALVSLGSACWWARDDGGSRAARAIVGAMLIYNVAVIVLVLFGGLGSLGPLQWAAVVLHGAMGIWCARVARA